MGHWQEIYSIAESFIDLAGIPGDLVERCHKVRSHIFRWVGIPRGIGIEPTKTLAKLANHIAKTAERKPGSYPAHFAQVCNLAGLTDDERRRCWRPHRWTRFGGRRIAAQLIEAGVHTVQDLVQIDQATVRRRWSIVLDRTVRELQGVSCVDLDDGPTTKKEIAATRSFDHPVTELGFDRSGQ